MGFCRQLFFMVMVSFICVTQAEAGGLIQAVRVDAQPQIDRDSEGFKFCGIWVNATVLGVQDVEVYSFSMTLVRDKNFFILKAGKSRAPSKSLEKDDYQFTKVTPGPIEVWLAKEGESATLSPKKLIAADTAGYVVGAVGLTTAFDHLFAIIVGKRMQIALNYENEPQKSVISFATQIPEVEQQAIMSCVQGVAERMVSGAQTPSP